MANLYSQTIVGDGVSTYTVGGNTKRIFPTSEMGTPKITPIMINTNEETLPSGNTYWTDNDSNAGNYSITSEFQTRGDIFLAVQAIQQFCEVYEVGGTTSSEHFTVLCRDSSIPYDAGDTFQNDGNTITVLQDAVRAALGGALVEVQIGRIVDDDTDG
jgi:hypothetical protein